MAWHVGAFSRVKRMGPLRRYLGRHKAAPVDPPTERERQQILATAARWADELNERGNRGK